MRSIPFTLFLLFAALVSCGIAVWQWQKGSFDVIFGAPPVPVGEHLYHHFGPDEVKRIRVQADDVIAVFELTDKGWFANSPWADRMDPRAALSIIQFALGMRVEDYVATEDVELKQMGLQKSTVTIQMEDSKQKVLSHFRLGRLTPWKAQVEKVDQPVSTVFVMPLNKGDKKYVYCCTGDINPLFLDNLRFLRDHRPLYFNPTQLKSIRIRGQEGDLTLGRIDAKSPWRIVKPLDLPTDPAAMKALIEGLYELQAVKVRDLSAVTLPEGRDVSKTQLIALQSFQAQHETLLEISAPAGADATEVLATASDRPQAVFDLPLKPESNLVSLASLPMSVNGLRDPRLSHLNVASLRNILIEPSTGIPISIHKAPAQPWMVSIQGQEQEANEMRLYDLLKAVTSHKVTGYESDAATDFSPWGLDRPFLKLQFTGENKQVLELRFGMNARGEYFVNRQGTATVVKVDAALVGAISIRPYEWRHARLWSLDRTQLVALKVTSGKESPLVLKYDDAYEAWKAERDGKDMDAELDPSRANFLLTQLEGLVTERWLNPNDESALAALKSPALEIGVTEFVLDDEFEIKGVKDKIVRFAPKVKSERGGSYYGCVEGSPNLFLIDAETYGKLSSSLLVK